MKRKKTKLEEELEARGYDWHSIWVLVSKNPKGATRHQLYKILDNAQYTLGVQHIENIAMACGVTYMTVVDFIRLDKQPELMTEKEFRLYMSRIAELSNKSRIMWYVARFCQKKVPLFYILEELLEKTTFKKPPSGWVNKKDYVYHNYIKKGLYDSSKKKSPPPADSENKK